MESIDHLISVSVHYYLQHCYEIHGQFISFVWYDSHITYMSSIFYPMWDIHLANVKCETYSLSGSQPVSHGIIVRAP